MAKLKFNAATKEPMKERTMIPEGQYIASIIKSEIIDNKAKTGTRLNFEFKILNGDFKSSILYVGLNYTHENEVTQNISEAELKSICDAVGKGNDTVEDTQELHGIPCVVTVKHGAPSVPYEENGETKYRYGAKAEIKKYELLEGHEISGDFTQSATQETSSPDWLKD